MSAAQHTPWIGRQKPLLKWSPRFRCWICAGQGVDAQASDPRAAFDAWSAAIAKAGR